MVAFSADSVVGAGGARKVEPGGDAERRPARRRLCPPPRHHGIVGGSTGMPSTAGARDGRYRKDNLASWMMKQQSSFRAHRAQVLADSLRVVDVATRAERTGDGGVEVGAPGFPSVTPGRPEIASAAMIRRRGICFVVAMSGSFVVFAAPDGLRSRARRSQRPRLAHIFLRSFSTSGIGLRSATFSGSRARMSIFRPIGSTAVRIPMGARGRIDAAGDRSNRAGAKTGPRQHNRFLGIRSATE